MLLLFNINTTFNISIDYDSWQALVKTIMNLRRQTSSVINGIANANNLSFIFTDAHVHLLVLFPPSSLPITRSLSLHLKSHIFKVFADRPPYVVLLYVQTIFINLDFHETFLSFSSLVPDSFLVAHSCHVRAITDHSVFRGLNFVKILYLLPRRAFTLFRRFSFGKIPCLLPRWAITITIAEIVRFTFFG